MQMSTGVNSRLVLSLMTIMAVLIGIFLLFEQQSTQWITSQAQAIASADGRWVVALFLIAVLAFDIVLPIPSSIIAVVAATTLGWYAGALVIWLGLMLSCCFGYWIGTGSAHYLLGRLAGKEDMAKAGRLSRKIGAGTLVALRGVPVLAETSVIAAGLVRYPWWSFIIVCALSNAGLAMAYGYVGSQAGAKDSFLLVVLASIVVPAGAWSLKLLWQYVFHPAETEFNFDSAQHSNNTSHLAVIESIEAKFKVEHHYLVLFSQGVFAQDNSLLVDLLAKPEQRLSLLVYLDSGVAQANPELAVQIDDFFNQHQRHFKLLTHPLVIQGGEAAKQQAQIEQRYQQLLAHQVDRHCCVIVIGGGAVLDAVGYACTTFHRGVKLLRMPSTVLAQNDAGVGVKNGFNFADKKNLIGTFSPPLAVVNDGALLQSLAPRDKRAGLAEAVKVAAIRDQGFFAWMEANAQSLSCFEPQASQYAIARCAQLHLKQITQAGDPFESGSARPLDYGHWCAHKLEAMANYDIRHGEAVAIGMALDARYAVNIGFLAVSEADRLINLLTQLGFDLWHPQLERLDDRQPQVLAGIEEFRQHLGGQLCITLIKQIGKGEEVGVIEQPQMVEALAWLREAH